MTEGHLDSSWSILCGCLVAVAAIATVVKIASSTDFLRLAGGIAAVGLLLTGAAAALGRLWALGTCFLFALLWAFSVSALTLAGRLSVATSLGWLAWSVLVMFATVRARASATEDLHA